MGQVTPPDSKVHKSHVGHAFALADTLDAMTSNRPYRKALGFEAARLLRDLQKVLAGEKLSPVLIAEGDIADGYHRVSLAYALDPYADVPLKLG